MKMNSKECYTKKKLWPLFFFFIFELKTMVVFMNNVSGHKTFDYY